MASTSFRRPEARSSPAFGGPPWATLAWALPAVASFATRMRAIDLAYHVRSGAIMLRSGGVLRRDVFTFTVPGEAWLNQQWGAQIVFAAAHAAFGWVGVAAVYAAALSTGVGALFATARRVGAAPRTACLLAIAGFMVASGSLAARPQALAVPLFTCSWWLLERGGRARWVVPILAAAWANVHGSFVLAPLLVVFAIWDDRAGGRVVGWEAVALLVVTTLATLATPFGAAVWTYAVEISTNETIRGSVAEWQPPDPLSVGGAPFWASGAAVAALAVVRRRSLRPVDVARLVVFFAIGVPALRGTLWWGLAAPAVVARWLAADPRAEPLRSRDRSPLTVAIGLLLLASIPATALARAGIDPVTNAPRRLAADAPQVLVDTTAEALAPGSRILVYQPFASWFEFAAPSQRVMVDSRIELYPPGVWADYDRILRAGSGLGSALDRYGVDAVVVPPGEPLGAALGRAQGWERRFDGAAGVVFVRTGAG